MDVWRPRGIAPRGLYVFLVLPSLSRERLLKCMVFISTHEVGKEYLGGLDAVQVAERQEACEHGLK
jgi:hypothetical protein